jgi:thiamine-monophosphate kinase
VLETGDGSLVITHDMIVEGVHYLPDDPPGDVAWKLLAVNLSDLAAKGARPLGVLLGYTLGDEEWDQSFASGFGTALQALGVPLLGGDTVSAPQGSARTLGLTAIGRSSAPVPSRSGAAPGNLLWVTGTIGDAGAGLAVLNGRLQGGPPLIERYRNPKPRLEAGERLATVVTTMMDVSDGLLIDAGRMAEASGCQVTVELDSVPLSEAFLEACGDGRGARLAAATAGDDYELLFATPEQIAAEILSLADEIGIPMSRVGRFGKGSGLSLTDRGEAVPAPEHLGFEHGG